MGYISHIELPDGTTYDIKLTSDAGSNLNPVYFNNGVPVASIGNSIPFVVGTGTTAGTWLGAIEGLTAYYDGLLFLYKSPVAGASTTTLNLNNLGAKTVYANASTKLTTHYPANQPILLAYSASTNSGCFVAIDNYWSSNTIGEYSGACKAGTNGMARYSLIMQTKQSGNDETWESLVTTSSTSTSKTKNSSGFIVGSPVLYQSASTYAKDGIAGTSGCWSTAYNVDTRYSCNVSSSWSAEGRPFFIKGTINSTDGLFYLADTTWWSDAYPTTNDGFYYIYVGQMCDAYRLSLYPENPIFYYNGGLKVLINGSVTNAQTVNGHTVEKDVPSNALFTDTQANWAQTTSTALDYIKNKPTFGTALTLDGTTVNHDDYGSEGTAGTGSATHGATLDVPYIRTNAQGHVTGKGTHTHTVDGLQYNTANVSRVVMMSDGQVSVQTKGYLSCNNYANTGFKPMTASAFNVSSSRKVKENIEPIADEEAYKLLDVTPVSFDYISEIGGAKNQFGVIAEEVNDILPFVVNIPEDYKENDGNYMNVPSVDYSKFIPHLIKLVQIQEQKINDLQQEIFELKNK